jgi:hypothetical protein
MNRKTLIANAVILGAVVMLLFAIRLRDVALPGMGTRTTSMVEVDVVLADREREQEIRLRLPQAYLVRARDRRGGDVESIRMEARMPNLGPAPASPDVVGGPGTPEYEQSLADFDNGVTFTLSNQYAYPPESQAELRSRYQQRFSQDSSSDQSYVFELVNPDYFGLRLYREFRCEDRDAEFDPLARGRECRDMGREHYLSINRNRPVVLIECNASLRTTLGGALGCTARTSFRGFGLVYTLRDTQLNRWVEFDDGVRRLLSDFVTAAQDGAND